MLRARWRLVAVTVALPLLVVGAAAGLGRPAGAPEVTSSALLVSGRDDHGLLQSDLVPLAAAADGTGRAGQLHDGTLVDLVEVRGRMHRVRAGSLVGWLDDEQPRSTVHLVGPPPSCAARLGDETLPAGEQAVLLRVADDGALVRLVRRPSSTGVVPAGWLSERAPQPAGGRCLPADVGGHRH